MGKIRSSWEIAQEKADELGDLSQEEQLKQKEERCLPIGNLLADNYLDNHDAVWLEKELDKYPVEDRDLIRQVALLRLIDYINLRSVLVFDNLVLGILSLTKMDSKVKEILGKLKELIYEYGQVEDVERQKMESTGREILHRQRISGTAVKMINARAREDWQNKLNELAYPFGVQINSFKQKLLALV